MNKHSLLGLITILFLIFPGCIDGPSDREENRINSDVSTLLYDEGSGQLFIGTEDNGFFIHSPGEDSWIHRTTQNGLPNNYISCVAYDGDSNRYFIGTQGLAIYDADEDTFENLDESHGIPSTTIQSVAYIPAANELYLGYSQFGFSIYQLDDGNLITYNSENTDQMGEGLPTNSVYAVVHDAQPGNMILGSIRDISIYDPGEQTFTNFNASNQPAEGLKTIKSIVLDEQNRILYIGTSHNAMWSFNLGNHVFENYDISLYQVSALALDPDSQLLYIGTVNLMIMDLATNSTVERTTEHGLPSNMVHALALDTVSNKLYLGTNNGPGLTIYNIDNDSFRTID